jgi:hypothetical protein
MKPFYILTKHKRRAKRRKDKPPPPAPPPKVKTPRPKRAPTSSEIYTPGTRVFLTDGPLVPGVILPPPEGTDPQFKVVLLEGEESPALIRSTQLIAATFTEGRRVFRHAGGPHRFGVIPPLRAISQKLSKERMSADDSSVIVRWDNGEMDVVAKSHLTPIIYGMNPNQ